MAIGDLGAPFISTEGDSIIVKWDRIEILIPESYFNDPPLAEDLGNTVEVLSFIDVRAYEKPDSSPRLFGIRLPARLRINYLQASTEIDEDGERVHVFTTRQGEVLVDDVNAVQSSDNVTALFRVMASARITGVSYADLSSLFIDGAKLNGAKTGVTPSILEALISEMARWSEDTSVPLRIPLVAGKATESDFQVVKLKDLPRLNSVFTGLGFEDVQLAIQSGVRKTLNKEPQRESPMERLVKL